MVLVAALFAALEVGPRFRRDRRRHARRQPVRRRRSLPYLFIGLGTVEPRRVAGLWRRRSAGCRGSGSSAASSAGPRSRWSSSGSSWRPGTRRRVPLAWLTVYAVGAIVGDDRVDDGRRRSSTPGRPSACSRCAPAPRSPAASSGTLLSGPVARALGTETLVVLEAVLLARRRAARRRGRRGRRRSGCRRGGAAGRSSRSCGSGFDSVVRLAADAPRRVAYVLLAILVFSVTYPFLQAASDDVHDRGRPRDGPRPPVGGVTATSFVVSLLVANRVYARFGVAGAALLLPLVYLGGFGLWLVAFSFATAAARSGSRSRSPSAACRTPPGARSTTSSRPSGARRSSPSTTASPARSGRSSSGLLLLAAGSRAGARPGLLAGRRDGDRVHRSSSSASGGATGQPAPDAAGRPRRAGPRGRTGTGGPHPRSRDRRRPDPGPGRARTRRSQDGGVAARRDRVAGRAGSARRRPRRSRPGRPRRRARCDRGAGRRCRGRGCRTRPPVGRGSDGPGGGRADADRDRRPRRRSRRRHPGRDRTRG